MVYLPMLIAHPDRTSHGTPWLMGGSLPEPESAPASGPSPTRLKSSGATAEPSPPCTALYMEASDLAGFHAKLEAAIGVRLVDPLASRSWGQDEFTVEDHEGNWLTFWTKVSAG